MTLLLVLFLLLGYAVLGTLHVIATRGAPRRVRWLGFAAIAAAAPAFFWIGTFTERFEAAQCYSEAFRNVALAAERSGSSTALAERLRALPLRGYETACTEVADAVRGLPGVRAP